MFWQWKDLCGLSALRRSLAPPDLSMLSLKCIWPTKLCLYHNHATQLRRSGQNSGTPQGGFKFGLFTQINQMYEWVFIFKRPCLPPMLWLCSPYALLSSSKAPTSLHVCYASVVFGVVTVSSAFLCFVSCEGNSLQLLQCCGLPSLASQGTHAFSLSS